MSTRCNVVIFDKFTDPQRPIMFYRHSDGYPEGVKDTLDAFVAGIAEGRLRDNDEQAAGWLVVLGAQEYGCLTKDYGEAYVDLPVRLTGDEGVLDWQVGCYEPCVDLHGDIEYVHFVDIERRRWFATRPPKGVWDAKRTENRQWVAKMIADARAGEELPIVEEEEEAA